MTETAHHAPPRSSKRKVRLGHADLRPIPTSSSSRKILPSLKNLRDAISGVRPGHDGTLYVTKTGVIGVHATKVGATTPNWALLDHNLAVLFRFPVVADGDGLLGPQAAQDEEYVVGLFRKINAYWNDKSLLREALGLRSRDPLDSATLLDDSIAP